MLDYNHIEQQYHGKIGEPSTDFIWGDFIDTDICDELIDFYDTQDIIDIKTGRIGRTGPDGDHDTDFKESMDLAVPAQINVPVIRRYREALQEVHYKYVDKFLFSDTGDYGIVQPMNIQKYPPGEVTRLGIQNEVVAKRGLRIVILFS